MTIRQIAIRLIELSELQQFSQARKELFNENAICIEAGIKPITGLKALDEKEKSWRASFEAIHVLKISRPLINGNFFSIAFSWDMTYRGKERSQWKEIAIFEVKGEKIVFEQFFY